jgi:fructose-1,6-bisphosphatase/inositol monophosphatase family enzyme
MSGWSVEAVTAIIRETAETEILPRWRRLETHQIREKSPGNLVTEADVEAERVLTRRLTDLLPGSVVVGEEAVAADPGVLRMLEGAAPVWIVDPVDGTGNFARHSEVFGVIVALVQDGRTLAGWIHEPVANRTAWAVAGEGGWIDGGRVTVTAGVPLEQLTGSVRNTRKMPMASRVRALTRVGCVARDYLDLAAGRLNFAHYVSLAPWDHAAGVLLVQEAGGYAALMDGAPYRPIAGQSGMLIAASQDDWQRLRGLFG